MTLTSHQRQLGRRLRVVMWGVSAILCTGMIVRAQVQADTPSDKPEDTAVGAILSIHGEITDVMADSVERRIEDARAKGASVIIFDLDTPGGLVTSSIAVADLIKELSDIKTVAWVHPNAHSGGSIVAVAADEIVMGRSSRMGDSQVIMGGPTGVGAVPEELQPKAYTPVLAEFRASARLNGYDQVLCEAFVLPDREVWWVENIKTQERKFVFREEKLRLLGEKEETPPPTASDEAADKPEDGAGDTAEAKPEPIVVPPAQPTEWKLVETYYDPLLEMDVEALQPIVRDDQLLEMSASEAQAYGFSKGVVANEKELRSRYSLGSLLRLVPSWSEALAYWLTSMYVRGFLMLIILLGAYVEFHTPGVGVPGMVALIALAIFVGAPYLTGLANVWEILFIVVGILLIVLEVFVIPGFGVAGIAGIFMILIGLLATFVPDEPGRRIPLYIPELPATWYGLKLALATMVSSMLASLVGVFILSRYLPHMPAFKHIVPANPTPSEVLTGDAYSGAARVGDVGIAEGPLHPAGKARFGSVLVDVVTQGEYLDGDARIEVIERRGNRVVVRAIT